MSLVPLIQPPVMKLFTTQKEREIVMEQLREVTRFEKNRVPNRCNDLHFLIASFHYIPFRYVDVR